MKGDFSRRTFDREKRYSAVLQEQGRMMTDADLEEEHRILADRIESDAAELIGGCGGPFEDAGFGLLPVGSTIEIGEGSYYVDGIRVENEGDLPGTGHGIVSDAYWPPAGGTGRYVAYLDVWRRLITALDDPSIREVALGGPTTAAREQTVWQVRLERVEGNPTCLDGLPDLHETTGEMAARATPEAAMTDPCDVPPSAGFKGLENQFYRIEVHDQGEAFDVSGAADVFDIGGFPADATNAVTLADPTVVDIGDAVEVYAEDSPLTSTFAHVTAKNGSDIILSADLPGLANGQVPRLRRVRATFVWSRDNGSVVTGINRIEATEISVQDLGPDEVLGFAPNQWVEITDDRNELDTRPGQLARIASIDTVRQVIVLKTPVSPLDPDPLNETGVHEAMHPKIRRWDGAGAIRFHGADPEKDWIHLESGVQVRFTDASYRTGDYWHFAARTAVIDPALGNIDWPVVGGQPELRFPHGVEHSYCPLAMIDVVIDDQGEIVTVDLEDCRNLFPPVTRLSNLLYVGGDGQEGTPDPADPGSRSVVLDAPLQVRVTNGSFPVVGAQVRFEITAGTGQLEGTGNMLSSVSTLADGIATCDWMLDGATPVQECQARLLDAAGDPIPNQAVNFHASLSTARRVSYNPSECDDLAGVKTVQEAVDKLCQRETSGGKHCCCVAIGPEGDFETIQDAIEAMLERKEANVCLCLMPGDHELPELLLGMIEVERPWNLRISGCGWGSRLTVQGIVRLNGLNRFAMRNLDVAFDDEAHIFTVGCRDVSIRECRISGPAPKLGLIRIHFASRVAVSDSTFEALQHLDGADHVGFLDEIHRLPDLYMAMSWRKFEPAARELAQEFASLDPQEQQNLGQIILALIQRFAGRLSAGEVAAYQRLGETLLRDPGNVHAYFDHFVGIRHALVRVNPGVALEVGDILESDDGQLSPASTRDGMATIENNDIVGLVGFHGAPDIEFELAPEEIEPLFAGLRNERIELSAHDPSAHVRDNRLTRLVIGTGMTNLLHRLAESPEGQIQALMSSFHCTDNDIDGATSVLMARHLSLAGNQFSLSSIRGRDIGEFRDIRVADAIGDSAVYTGNHAERRGHGFTFGAQIGNITRTSAEAANLELTLMP